MLAHEFMRNALLAGSATAVACGLVGYLVVLRAQVFVGDALGHVAFTGALAAVAFGASVRLGLFATTIVGALAIGLLGERARADDVAIGSFFAWALGLGVLFLAIFSRQRSAGDGTGGVRVLFGSIFGLGHRDVLVSVAIAAGVAALVALGARRLLFATLDPEVALARGVPVRALGLVFLAVLGVVAAEATQSIGALLLLGLLAAPAGAAHRLTVNPYRGLLLAPALALVSVWGGLSLSYVVPSVPPSSAVVGVATAVYLGALVVARRSPGLRTTAVSHSAS